MDVDGVCAVAVAFMFFGPTRNSTFSAVRFEFLLQKAYNNNNEIAMILCLVAKLYPRAIAVLYINYPLLPRENNIQSHPETRSCPRVRLF